MVEWKKPFCEWAKPIKSQSNFNRLTVHLVIAEHCVIDFCFRLLFFFSPDSANRGKLVKSISEAPTLSNETLRSRLTALDEPFVVRMSEVMSVSLRKNVKHFSDGANIKASEIINSLVSFIIWLGFFFLLSSSGVKWNALIVVTTSKNFLRVIFGWKKVQPIKPENDLVKINTETEICLFYCAPSDEKLSDSSFARQSAVH